MTTPARSTDDETVTLLTAAGITPTDEGRRRARARLDQAEAEWTPERRERSYAEHDRRVADAAA